MPRATSLAAAIRDKTGIECEIIRGGGGIFDVMANEEMIFSKGEVGRFPEDDEILSRLP